VRRKNKSITEAQVYKRRRKEIKYKTRLTRALNTKREIGKKIFGTVLILFGENKHLHDISIIFNSKPTDTHTRTLGV
jgi:hypothetical protein